MLNIKMLSVIMLNVDMLNVIMLSVMGSRVQLPLALNENGKKFEKDKVDPILFPAMRKVIRLCDIKLHVVMLNVIMLSVMWPRIQL